MKTIPIYPPKPKKNITVNISGEALIRSCSKDSDFADFGDKFGCILNIQLSHVN